MMNYHRRHRQCYLPLVPNYYHYTLILVLMPHLMLIHPINHLMHLHHHFEQPNLIHHYHLFLVLGLHHRHCLVMLMYNLHLHYVEVL